MNLITLGLGGAALITLGLLTTSVILPSGALCLSESSQSVTLAESSYTLTADDDAYTITTSDARADC